MGDGVGSSWQVSDVLGVEGWVCIQVSVVGGGEAGGQVVTVGVIEL